MMFDLIATHINKDKYKVMCFGLRKFYFMRSLRRYKYYKHGGKRLGTFLKDLLDYFMSVWKWNMYEIKGHLKYDNIVLLSRPQFIHFGKDDLLDEIDYGVAPCCMYGMYCIRKKKEECDS